MAVDASQPHVLLLTRNYPPLTGGMERLMHRASQGLANWAQLTIVGPAGCGDWAPGNSTVYEVPSSLGGFVTRGSLAAWRACRGQRFDLVIGGSGLAGPILRLLQLRFGVRTAVYLHGLDVIVDNFVYQKLFVPSLRSVDLVIANSRNTRQLALEKGVRAERISVINPGTDLPDSGSIAPAESFRRKFDIPFAHILLFTGRITRRKGLSRFIANCLPNILAAVPDAGLVVVGENPEQSLNRQGEIGEVLARVDESGLSGRIRFLGEVSDEDLLAAYAAADVQVFPLVDVPGDVEGFGMVAIEAAACGTPTVAFDTGGVADAVSPDNGQLVAPGDYPSLAAAVVEALQSGQPGRDACIAHARRYAWPGFNARFRDALNPLLSSPGDPR